MNYRDVENETLSFRKPQERGSVLETFFPWHLTIDNFLKQGLPVEIGAPLSSDPAMWKKQQKPHKSTENLSKQINVNEETARDIVGQKYFQIAWGEHVARLESYLGFDSLRRISFVLPFRNFEEQIMEETDTFIIKRDRYFQMVEFDKLSGSNVVVRPPVRKDKDWQRIKEKTLDLLDEYFSSEQIRQAYTPLKSGHEKGMYSVRLNIEGFFWIPRELLGIEPHLYAFYDQPDLLHDINQTILEIYIEKLSDLLSVIPVDVIYIMEDLSGKNGPMLSPDLFDEFIGSYYKQLIPVLKKNGARHIFVDTDGDFRRLIPNFVKAGVEGFLPLDVNAGIDIVSLREEFPELKLIGGFNKLSLLAGKSEIDREFERLLPVVRQGGYIPGNDHQVAPGTRLDDYAYYVEQLKIVMRESGRDCI